MGYGYLIAVNKDNKVVDCYKLEGQCSDEVLAFAMMMMNEYRIIRSPYPMEIGSKCLEGKENPLK